MIDGISQGLWSLLNCCCCKGRTVFGVWKMVSVPKKKKNIELIIGRWINMTRLLTMLTIMIPMTMMSNMMRRSWRFSICAMFSKLLEGRPVFLWIDSVLRVRSPIRPRPSLCIEQWKSPRWRSRTRWMPWKSNVAWLDHIRYGMVKHGKTNLVTQIRGPSIHW